MRATNVAADNVDRMLLRVLEETFATEPWRQRAPVAVVNDATGALTSWVLERGLDARFVQDSAALAAAQHPHPGVIASLPSAQSLTGVASVIYRLARPLEALEEMSWHVARWAAPEVTLLAGQRERHLNRSMNRVLAHHFRQVSASRGYYKSRALRATVPLPLTGETPPRIPRKNTVNVAGHQLALRAYGLTFGAARLDPGTALLLEALLQQRAASLSADTFAVDLGSGNGTIATTLAKVTDAGRILATDDSASAVASTRATLAANSVTQVEVAHQTGLVGLAAETVDVVVLNAPFHEGTELTSDVAHWLFDEAARVLKPAGILFTVFNASLGYRPQLRRRVGPTAQLIRDNRFIVTESQKV